MHLYCGFRGRDYMHIVNSYYVLLFTGPKYDKIGASIRIGFWGTLYYAYYYKYSKEPAKTLLVIVYAPILIPSSLCLSIHPARPGSVMSRVSSGLAGIFLLAAQG